MPRLAAIILAAGASTRMGAAGPKALLRTREGETFLERAIRLAAAVETDPIVVVTGAHALAVPAPAIAAQNIAWRQGQLSSLQVGLAHVGPADGVLVLLVDHPLVRLETVRMLVEAFDRRPTPLVRPVHHGRRGHPVIFAASLFDELRATPVDQGARPVVQRHRAEGLEIEMDDPGVLADLDTPEDLSKL